MPGRILHILKLFRPDYTGAGIHLERVAPVMQTLRPDVRHDLLVTVTPPPRPGDPAGVPACHLLERITFLDAGPFGGARYTLSLLGWAAVRLWRYRAVHVHTHVDRSFLLYLLLRLTGRRLVLAATLDDSVPVLVETYKPRWRPLVRRLVGLFHRFLSISPRLHEETERVYPGRSVLLPVGVVMPDLDPARRAATRARLGVAEDTLLLLAMGSLCARKDQGFLIEAMPRLLAEGLKVRLVLVGPDLEPDYAAGLRRRVTELGLSEAVLFHGETRAPYPLFEAADLFVFASQNEGFGVVTTEAMAHGLPVVVRHLPGVTDGFVRAGETGVPFTTEDEYVAGVVALGRDPDLRSRFGAEGVRTVTRSYAMPRVAAGYLDLYRLASPPAADPVPPDLRAVQALPAQASLTDARVQADMPADRLPDRPVLVTILDAEESFDWTREFSREATDVRAMAAVSRVEPIFRRHGVVPIHMVDYPVADQEAGWKPLAELLADGRCEIGAQLHPWVTPPHEETVNRRNSFTGNLPVALQYAKLRHLTRRIEDTLNVRPWAHRAGRYGIGARTADLLLSLGYDVDTSLQPWYDYSDEGGPRFFGVPEEPVFADPGRRLLVLPSTASLVGPGARLTRRAPGVIFSPLAIRLRLQWLAGRTGFADRVKVTPEGVRLPDAQRLVRLLAGAGRRIFTVSFHTPSLAPGNTPYVRTEADLARLLDWLDGFYTFFREEIGGTPIALSALRDRLMGRPKSDAAAPLVRQAASVPAMR